jgi:hypothetical protein
MQMARVGSPTLRTTGAHFIDEGVAVAAGCRVIMVSARLLPSVKEELSYTSGQQSLEMEAELGATLLYASQSPSRFGKLNSGSLRKPEGKWNVTAEAMGWLEGPKAPWAIVST